MPDASDPMSAAARSSFSGVAWAYQSSVSVAPPPRGYVAFRNGVLNLASMKLEQPSRGLVFANVIPHKWNPEADERVVLDTLMKIASYDVSVFTSLCELMGLCMYRGTELGAMALLVGSGSNGKSTYERMLQAILGEGNYSTLPLQDLGKRFQSVPLMGKLANIGDDISADMVNGEACAVVKKLVTGERVNAEEKGGETFNFRPYATLVFSCNEVPRFTDTSHGFNRRLMPIPLSASFSIEDSDYDPLIEEKLTTEAAIEAAIVLGITALRCALDRGRLTPNALSEDLMNTIRLDNDSVLMFVSERFNEQGATLEGQCVAGVYEDYRNWCASGGYQPVAKNTFTRRITSKLGFKSDARKLSTGESVRCFVK